MVQKLFLALKTTFFLFLLTSNSQAYHCKITTSNISFGNYDIFSNRPKDTVSTLTVNCNIPPQSPHAPLLVSVSLSPGLSGNIAQRQMETSGGDRLNYNLYTNASFSNIWGDEGSFSVQTAFITKDVPYIANIYGRIPPKQNVAVGFYSDVVIVTINW